MTNALRSEQQFVGFMENMYIHEHRCRHLYFLELADVKFMEMVWMTWTLFSKDQVTVSTYQSIMQTVANLEEQQTPFEGQMSIFKFDNFSTIL